MTKDMELELAKQFRDSLPRESYLWDLVNEAMPYWEEFMRSDGFHDSLGGLYDRKKELELDIVALEDKAKKINQSIISMNRLYLFLIKDKIKDMIESFSDLKNKSIEIENSFNKLNEWRNK